MGEPLLNDLGKAKRKLACSLLDEQHVQARQEIIHSEVPFAPWDYDAHSSEISTGAGFAEEVTYVTGSDHALSMLVHVAEVARADVPLMTEYEQLASCRLCNGSSGGCPGFAPRFTSLRRKAQSLFVITVTIDFAWALKYAGMTSWKLPAAWCDRLSMAYVNRLLRKVQDAGYFILGLGKCAGKCNPCTVTAGEPCEKPKKRTYSMEAVGVDCDMLHLAFYDEYLPWAYWGMKFSDGLQPVPTYMTRYAGVLTSDDGVVQHIRDAIHRDWSYRKYAVEVPEVRAYNLVVPERAHHAGCKMPFYKMERVEDTSD
jgi:predicted metal-binding protein